MEISIFVENCFRYNEYNNINIVTSVYANQYIQNRVQIILICNIFIDYSRCVNKDRLIKIKTLKKLVYY
jgi:hypothetical protein